MTLRRLLSLIIFLIPREAYVSQLSYDYRSLLDVECARLVGVKSYDAKTNRLTAVTKKQWGSCAGAKAGEVGTYELWKGVEWTDESVSPIEAKFFDSFASRDFSKGGEIVLVSSIGPAETFPVSPSFLEKLEIVFDRKKIASMVERTSAAKLVRWLNDHDLGQLFFDEMTKQKKLTPKLVAALVLKDPQQSPSPLLEMYLKAVGDATKLDVFRLLAKSVARANVPRLLESLVSYHMAGAETDARIHLLEALDPKSADHQYMIYSSVHRLLDDEKAMSNPSVRSRVLDKGVGLTVHYQEHQAPSLVPFAKAWKETPVAEKKRLAMKWKSALIRPRANVPKRKGPPEFDSIFNAVLFHHLEEEMKSSGNLTYFEILKVVWSRPEFHRDCTSRGESFLDSLRSIAKAHPSFEAAAAEYEPVMKKLYRPCHSAVEFETRGQNVRRG